MIERIRKISIKRAGLCALIIGTVAIMVHIMVIAQIIPYTWVNGGRTTTYLEAKDISKTSILILLVNMLIVLVASKIIPVKLNKIAAILLSVFLIATLPLSLVGVIQQFLGTTFERSIMGIITIIGFLADVRIALEKRW